MRITDVLALVLTLALTIQAFGQERPTLTCQDGTAGPVRLPSGPTVGACDDDATVDGTCTFRFPDFTRRACRPLVDCPGPTLVLMPVGHRRGIPIKAGRFVLTCVPAEQPGPLP